MSERIAINTGPLIALGKMQALAIIAQLPYEFICPAQVEAEIMDGVALGYPVALPAWVNALSLQTPLTPVTSLALDDGEAAVIQLALEQRLTRVCIDELKGRRAALSVGLRMRKTLVRHRPAARGRCELATRRVLFRQNRRTRPACLRRRQEVSRQGQRASWRE
jgi:predicted nucleic acid-binding protein